MERGMSRDAKVRYWLLRLEQARRIRLVEDTLGLPARLPAPTKAKQHRLVAGLVAAIFLVSTPLGIVYGTRARNTPPVVLAPPAATAALLHRRRAIGYRLPPRRLNSCSILASRASIPSFA